MCQQMIPVKGSLSKQSMIPLSAYSMNLFQPYQSYKRTSSVVDVIPICNTKHTLTSHNQDYAIKFIVIAMRKC